MLGEAQTTGVGLFGGACLSSETSAPHPGETSAMADGRQKPTWTSSPTRARVRGCHPVITNKLYNAR